MAAFKRLYNNSNMFLTHCSHLLIAFFLSILYKCFLEVVEWICK